VKHLEDYTQILRKYVPNEAAAPIAEWIVSYGIHLKITRARNSKLGDFRPIIGSRRGHVITINHNLNPYSFLITLVHEIAHCTNWNKHQSYVSPHGGEWKSEYVRHLKQFLHPSIFPADVFSAVEQHLMSPSSSSCSDLQLMRVLKKYDQNPSITLESLPMHAVFKLKGNRVFRKGEKVRKNYRCFELPDNKAYWIHPLAEVELY
jgi:SprT protein